jgi:hypothetical protein
MTLRETLRGSLRRTLRGTLRIGVATLIAGLLLQGNAYAMEPQPAGYEWQKCAAVTFDLIILRPLRAAALAVGIMAFGPAALLSAPGGRDSYRDAEEMFIIVPARSLFETPLGDF